MKNLNSIDVGEYAEISHLLTKGSMRQRLLDIGLTPDTVVECVGKSPSGDPKAFLIRGAVIAIRSEDCAEILIK
ncbi:MAG: FeoA family protein [Acutalibacteraceae bacterium]|nr:FeoA family protein [Acutalibacteraceae bacterium]